MDDLVRYVAAERENVERTLAGLDETLARSPLGRVELAAMAAFLHNVYNGMENILKQITRRRGGKIPTGPSWHKELLDLATSLRVISEPVAEQLYQYLAFRHFFVHGYAMTLKEEQLRPLAQEARNAWNLFMREVEHAVVG